MRQSSEDKNGASDWMLTTLAAARFEALCAKAHRTTVFLVEWALVLWAVVTAVWWQPMPLIGYLAVIWIVVARVFLHPREHRRRRRSAFLAEAYERRAFEMEPGYQAGSENVSPEEIASAARNYDRIMGVVGVAKLAQRAGITPADPRGALRNWYPPAASTGPRQAIEWQRASAEYARQLSTTWSRVAFGSLVLVVCIIVWVGWAKIDPAANSLLYALVLPVLPVLLSMVDSILTASAGSARRNVVVRACDEFLLADDRRLRTAVNLCERNQRLAYLWRCDGPGIPESIYWLKRPGLERAMHIAAERG